MQILLANMPMIQIAMFVFQIFLTAMIWVARKEFVTRTEFDGYKNTLMQIQNKIEYLPNMTTITNLSNQIALMTGELKVFEERFKNFEKLSNRMQSQVNIMDGFLRERPQK